MAENKCDMPNKPDCGATKLNADQSAIPTETEVEEPIVYDYMKYAKKNKKGKGVYGKAKVTKSVSFKQIVELVTFTEDWKMLKSQSHLRTDEEQRKCTISRRNF
ncbi:uncharacterized protein LOC6559477 [Drosophila grimshawi]|uniref:GH19752 n=1 Tax=Drosophila grimshawi TaxID=7222 RepID=B4J463_DROGR|nr:uncharacterized protein LOC6559477 [Drosophila grimshawi]EDW02669.1 GH19752 [Drosophila grimshawi]